MARSFQIYRFGVIAIRLYDGVSYINISNPFVLAPEITFNKFIWYQEKKAVGTSTSLHTHSIVINMDIPVGLEDLISGVDVYLSQPESFIDTENKPKEYHDISATFGTTKWHQELIAMLFNICQRKMYISLSRRNLSI